MLFMKLTAVTAYFIPVILGPIPALKNVVKKLVCGRLSIGVFFLNMNDRDNQCNGNYYKLTPL